MTQPGNNKSKIIPAMYFKSIYPYTLEVKAEYK